MENNNKRLLNSCNLRNRQITNVFAKQALPGQEVIFLDVTDCHA